MSSLQQVERVPVNYVSKTERFVVNTKNYNQQYNGIYLARLLQMKADLRSVAAKKWGKDVPILAKIIDIESEHQHQKENKQYIVIGTLYKDMHLRGSVLDDFRENNGISGAVQSLFQIASEKDNMVLEDESGRIALGGSKLGAEVPHLVTGVVVAMKGTIDDRGVLDVNDWVFSHTIQSVEGSVSATTTSPAALQQHSVPVPSAHSKYLLLVSGLHIGNPLPVTASSVPTAGAGQASELSAQLLIDFVAGRLGGQQADIDIASRIARVIIAGDSVAPVDESVARERHSSFKSQKLAVSPSKQLDILLGQLLTVCPVDILPGAIDPSNLTMPQQPLHPCLFPQCCRFAHFNRVTNPYEAVFDGVAVLGHAGQPVSDIARQRIDGPLKAQDEAGAAEASAAAMDVVLESLGDDDAEQGDTIAIHDDSGKGREKKVITGAQSVDILQDTLTWGHICPTSPDTLPCYPFENSDPFIIADTRIPNLYFSGNQTEYATRLVTVQDPAGAQSSAAPKYVRLVSVPCFATTGMVVLVDISTPELVTTTLSFR